MFLQSRSISAVLPDPTGPPTPTRRGPWDLVIVTLRCHSGLVVRDGALRLLTMRGCCAGKLLAPHGEETRAAGRLEPCRPRCIRTRHHDLNSRVYCVSWRSEARSARKVALPRSSSVADIARLTVAT